MRTGLGGQGSVSGSTSWSRSYRAAARDRSGARSTGSRGCPGRVARHEGLRCLRDRIRGQTQPVSPARQDLIVHSLAVACAAKRIAEMSEGAVSPHLAYSAGLLHDIGKFALQDVMPKSLTAIVQEAEAAKANLYTVEQRHLGTNHAMLGKQLAQRWRLPGSLVTAIWLHHSDTITLLEGMAETALARVVWAANHLTRYGRDRPVGQLRQAGFPQLPGRGH